jgi:hypothetical protein
VVALDRPRRVVVAVAVEVDRPVNSYFEGDALVFEVDPDPVDLTVALVVRDFLESRVDAICVSLH